MATSERRYNIGRLDNVLIFRFHFRSRRHSFRSFSFNAGASKRRRRETSCCSALVPARANFRSLKGRSLRIKIACAHQLHTRTRAQKKTHSAPLLACYSRLILVAARYFFVLVPSDSDKWGRRLLNKPIHQSYIKDYRNKTYFIRKSNW